MFSRIMLQEAWLEHQADGWTQPGGLWAIDLAEIQTEVN